MASRQRYTPLHPLLCLSLMIPPSWSLLPVIYFIISFLSLSLSLSPAHSLFPPLPLLTADRAALLFSFSSSQLLPLESIMLHLLCQFSLAQKTIKNKLRAKEAAGSCCTLCTEYNKPLLPACLTFTLCPPLFLVLMQQRGRLRPQRDSGARPADGKRGG